MLRVFGVPDDQVRTSSGGSYPQVTYDEESRSAWIALSPVAYGQSTSRIVEAGEVLLEYDATGQLVGIELLGLSKDPRPVHP